MPIYEYVCGNCPRPDGTAPRVIEIMQKFSDPPLASCPDCGGSVEKKMSLSSFALKGSGWYSTDYKKSSSKSEVPAKAGASESSATPACGAPACGTGSCAAN